jgi:hypothetical protein
MRALGLVVVSTFVLLACPQPVPNPPADAGEPCGTCAPIVVPPDCSVPPSIDFGVVRLGETATRSLSLDNPSTDAQVVTLGTPSSTDFTVSPSGPLTLAPSQSQRVSITWRPTRVGTGAKMLIQRAASCAAVEVQLVGQSVDSFLSWTPTALDFGYVRPGLRATRTVTFTNFSGSPVQLGALRSVLPFGFVGATSRTIPARGSLAVEVAFAPVTLGPTTGELTFSTDLPDQSMGTIALEGRGGGPQLLAPDALDFGQVPGESGLTLPLEVENIGFQQVPNDPAANLHFGMPAFALRPLNANTSVSEFLVSLPADYDPVVGLPYRGKLQLDVALTPNTNGLKAAELTLFTNDLATPAKVVMLNADVADFPGCTYAVAPRPLDFGVVRPYSVNTLPLTVTNLGNTPCTLLDATVVQGNAWFSVDRTRTVIAPGMKHDVIVTANPLDVSAMPVTGAVRLSFSSATNPQTIVPLSAQGGEGCLTIPAELRFGTLQTSCGSGPRVVPVYNMCSTPVMLQVAIDGSLEFQMTGAPTGSTVLAAGAPLNLTFTYRPTNVGADLGTVRFSTVQNGQSVQQVMKLKGESNATGQLQVALPATPAAPVRFLMVVDDSSSMAAEQLALVQALNRITPSVLTRSILSGVVDTELTGPTAGVPRTLNNQSWFLNLPSMWSSLVQAVGTSGSVESCLSPAARVVRSLPAGEPVVVLCVTDSGDQAPYPLDQYLTAMHVDRPEVSFNVVGPMGATPPAGCTWDDPTDGRLDAAAGATGGARREICGANFDEALGAALGPSLTLARREFRLEQPADPASVTVTVDQLAIPAQMGTQTYWTYDVARQMVVFTPLAAPAPGQMVTVSFTALCQ